MEKNLDPRMHSAEHILNQVMDRMFGCGRAKSLHLEKKKSKCDYHFSSALTDTQVREIEKTVNEIIQGNLPVTEVFMSREEALRTYNLTRLPADAGDRIRIVQIGDYDACPCIGPHVAATPEIGRFQIVSTDFAGETLRIRFKLL